MIDVIILNVPEIKSTISDLTNIKADKLRIRVDINEKDEVVQITVIVDDRTTADIISGKVNELDCKSSSSDSGPY